MPLIKKSWVRRFTFYHSSGTSGNVSFTAYLFNFISSSSRLSSMLLAGTLLENITISFFIKESQICYTLELKRRHLVAPYPDFYPQYFYFSLQLCNFNCVYRLKILFFFRSNFPSCKSFVCLGIGENIIKLNFLISVVGNAGTFKFIQEK